MIATMVLGEFANAARCRFGLDGPRLAQSLRDIRRLAEGQALTVEVHELALDIAARYRFGVHDALIAASALDAGCTRLLTEDLQHGRRVRGRLTIRNPFIR